MPTTMAQLDSQTISQPPNQTNPTSAIVIRRPNHRRVHLRRRKTPVVRLGGQKSRRRLYLVRIFRKFRLRWLKLYYARMLQKLKNYYREVIKDIGDASATLESFQQRVFMESTFAVPVMGVSMSSYPTLYGSDRPRTANMLV